MHRDVNHNTVQVVLDHKNLRGDVPYMLRVLLILLPYGVAFGVIEFDHQELLYPFQYVDRLYS